MPENNLNMTPKAKKILFIALFAVDIALTVFLFVVSIIMLATLPEFKDDIDPTTFIGYLQANPSVFLIAFVIPLFALLIANIVALVFYLRRGNKKKKPSEENWWKISLVAEKKQKKQKISSRYLFFFYYARV